MDICRESGGGNRRFPGTAVIAEQTWDIKSRPWFMAAFGGEGQLESKGLEETDFLTVPYLDVLAKSSILVRTYLKKPLGLDQFLVAVNLHLRDDTVTNGATFLGLNLTAEPPRLQLSLAIILSFLFFALLRWLSIGRVSNLSFGISEATYGMLNAKSNIRFRRERHSSSWKRYQLG